MANGTCVGEDYEKRYLEKLALIFDEAERLCIGVEFQGWKMKPRNQSIWFASVLEIMTGKVNCLIKESDEWEMGLNGTRDKIKIFSSESSSR